MTQNKSTSDPSLYFNLDDPIQAELYGYLKSMKKSDRAHIVSYAFCELMRDIMPQPEKCKSREALTMLIDMSVQGKIYRQQIQRLPVQQEVKKATPEVQKAKPEVQEATPEVPEVEPEVQKADPEVQEATPVQQITSDPAPMQQPDSQIAVNAILSAFTALK